MGCTDNKICCLQDFFEDLQGISSTVSSVGGKAKGLIPTGALASVQRRLSSSGSSGAVTPGDARTEEAAVVSEGVRQASEEVREAASEGRREEQSAAQSEQDQQAVVENST